TCGGVSQEEGAVCTGTPELGPMRATQGARNTCYPFVRMLPEDCQEESEANADLRGTGQLPRKRSSSRRGPEPAATVSTTTSRSRSSLIRSGYTPAISLLACPMIRRMAIKSLDVSLRLEGGGDFLGFA